MERLTRTDYVPNVAALAAHALNEHLTVILSGVHDAMLWLEPGHPARPVLIDAHAAARRCADTAAILLTTPKCVEFPRKPIRPLRFEDD